ncbi:Acyl transferase domain-containing protein [Streptomyces misionensis]|uniref:Acyl transferase domain-containing protein n=1 Tax=Streptomyces misionensis TaxID=67331 RepID=A0A1H4IAR9_9ACTN|nr:acyltransferase domain-containing protein [Streptomyces misionensis]SEB31063.1 Acyl transferase domain-containing protein [Streptomyces misionensis]
MSSTAPAPAAAPAPPARGPQAPPRLAFLLPGQGAQRPGMALGLYGVEESFTAAVNEVLDLYGPEGDRIRGDWASEHPAVPLDHVSRAQPLLFALDYALGRMLLAWGARPAVLLGHSAGEAAAAVLAGVMTLPDAVALLAERVELIADAPPGGMLAVAASEAEVAPYLTDEVVVGAVNAPAQLLLAGPEPQLTAVAGALTADGVVCARARATHGFHSPSMDDACRRHLLSVAAVPLRPPAITVLSGYTAAELTADQATDPEFWAGQPARQVRFGPALDRLLAAGPCHLVETGPGQSLSALARRHPGVTRGGSTVVSLLDARARGPHRDRAALLRAAEHLAALGHLSDPDAVARLRAALGTEAGASTAVRPRFETPARRSAP